jgi:hypothetical protein
MRKPFQVRCREASYDEQAEMLVLLCFFEEFGESRIVHFPRSDFHYKHPANAVPHGEMHKTANLFQGKCFRLVVDDDPQRSKEADTHPEALSQDFREAISEQLEQVSEGLTDPNRQIARKLGGVIERDMKRRKGMGDLLANEMIVRAKLKDVDFGT